MKNTAIFFLFFLLVACQNEQDNKARTSETETKVQEGSPTTRFNHFMEQFETVELPYTLSTINNFPRMENDYIEHFLEAHNDPEYGLTKSANCIATFKVGNNLAVVYKWMQRPAPGNAAEVFELAVYSPYGAKKGGVILGENQNSHQDFTKNLNFTIKADFSIITQHNWDFFVSMQEEEGPDSYVQFHTFFSNQYKITEQGNILQTKTTAFWEKIPNEFIAPFVESYKAEPQSIDVEIKEENGKTILSNSIDGFRKVIFSKLPIQGRDTVLFVSALEMEPIAKTQGGQDSFYVNSKISLLELQGTKLRIVTNEIIDSTMWSVIYQTIQTQCDCPTSPNVNENGIVKLSSIGSVVYNGVLADITEDNKIVFKCYKGTALADNKIIYTLGLDNAQ